MAASVNGNVVDPIGRKISLFENSEREKSEREERDRKRALFERKLSKFGQSFEQNGASRDAVGAKVKLFAEAPGAEERRKESERRKSEFQQKRSTFSGEAGCSFDLPNKVPARKVSERILAFDGSGQLEAEQRRRREEEQRLKLEAFQAKRGVYSN